MIMWIPVSLLLLSVGVFSVSISRFTNIRCEVLDPSYCSYKQCDLKILGRGIVGLNVQAKLLKGPFKNAKVNLSLWRKFNGFRPFMFNTTFDFCKFMARGTNKLSFEKIFLDGLAEQSNINHSCPYENELLVNNMVFKEEYFRFLPLPAGEYQIQLMAATDNQWKTRVYINVLRVEDLLKT